MTDLPDYACQSNQLSCKVLRDEIERLRSVATAEMKLREGNFAEIEQLRARVAELEGPSLVTCCRKAEGYQTQIAKLSARVAFLEDEIAARGGLNPSQWRALLADRVTELEVRAYKNRCRTYAWLGQWRDHMPPEAVSDLQDILGPLRAPAMKESSR